MVFWEDRALRNTHISRECYIDDFVYSLTSEIFQLCITIKEPAYETLYRCGNKILLFRLYY